MKTLRRLFPYIWLTGFAFLLFSCRATKYVPEGEYLLQNYRIESEKGEIDQKELKNYIKQRPNKRILFWRFYLSLYNLSNPQKDNGFHNWLRRIGEPPAVYDRDLMERSAEQIELFMQNKGYYDILVRDTALLKEGRKRARVVYQLEPGTPYRIRTINYFFEDPSLGPLVLADTGNTRFRTSELFDVDVLQEERERIEALARDSGYFAFSRDYVYFDVDSSLKSHQVDITLSIKNFPSRNEQGQITSTRHPQYQIRDVHMTTDYDPMSVVSGQQSMPLRDTLRYDSIYVLYRDEPNIRPVVVTQKNYIIPGDLFNASEVNRTYRNLTSLSAFRMVDIRFNEVPGEDKQIDCQILATPATRQSYMLKLEGTNSGGNIGAAANVSYTHRNLFGGSEQFDLSFRGAIESLQKTDAARDSLYSGPELMQEFGAEARLSIPKFLLPFRTDRFIRRFNPQTNIRLSYNYQKRPDYTRTLANLSLGYNWRGGENLSHRVYPMELSLILVPYKSDIFQNWLQGKYLIYSYEPHLIIDNRYSLVWSNQKLLKKQNFQDIRINLENSGNLLYAGFRAFDRGQASDSYQILGVDFAQYLKADIDFRSYNFLYEDISLVFRGFAGVAWAFGNSNAMPFEKQYFSGGANSIRGWQVKDLGPGSYEDPNESAFPNQTGDVKLEANMEYRFKLIWKLEAALFVDAGNIWSLSREDDRLGAGFEFDRFFKEIAVGTGIGTRAVFSFFVLRFDLGIPIRSPYPVKGSNWLPGNAGVRGEDLTFNIAIGYPF